MTASVRPDAPAQAPVGGFRAGLRAMWDRLESPVAPYYLILGSTVLLTLFGLIMVLSASSVTSYQDSGSSYTVFITQAAFALLGVIAAVVASRLPITAWKRLAFPVYVLAVLLLAAVIVSPFGYSVNGNRNWLRLAGFTFQPSEFGKLALVLVGAVVLVRKRPLIGRARHALIPYVLPLALVIIVLVMAGQDLGTTLVLGLIVATTLFVAGMRLRVFLAFGALIAAGAVVGVLTRGSRMDRVNAWLGTCPDARTGTCWQKVHGLYAMADGGWWGVGLGASREKWSWLPEAHNDFIFAIVGEELGLPGTLAVLALYLALAFGCYRLIVLSKDNFVRIATAATMVWIIGQAVINIGSVTGLLPIIGIPLPLLSAGGSALITTLLALGMVLSFARNEPACKQMLDRRPSLLRSALAVLPARGDR